MADAMKVQALTHPLIQRSYRRRYAALLDRFRVTQGTRVLDVGSGLGFLKPLVVARGGSYTGLEPHAGSFENACALYGADGFIRGFFPAAAPAADYDVIVALSCVDEVPDKAEFLRNLKARLVPGRGVGYIAVRNRGFFVNRLKPHQVQDGMSERSRISLGDLTTREWEQMIGASGLRIEASGKFWRPWLTGFTFAGVKNVAYRLISMVSARSGSYMVFFEVSAI
jgi:SAM-dependent methyltransferase